MKLNIGLISPTTFAIVLISFLLPWVSFSCNGHKFVSITGLDFVTGTTFEKPGKFEFGFWLAFLALLSATILNTYFFLEQRKQSLTGASASPASQFPMH